ncbi:hypothetical protein DTO021D3_7847 [Paecilomyces variotii]|nr:hypothetical protein DTO032I3_8515 [Paecilomyces variotii]KAJ9275309.1 hypothetical protein DTO021D3_7847 [Paecilomyces variotii]KAJ9339275.1 hypothetical protein DTO027B6_8158 [Paecilomyces variotii]KAJ9378449.1 hypothetical protein DTO032I4_7699 [Paecilomyces variotii]KAJ9410939.1 hypothetical protein DTO045G8_1260 [Paecilomyces variotii]
MSTTWAAANDPQPAMAHLASGPSPASRRPSSTTQRAPSPFLTERRSYAPRAPERGRGSESRRTTARSGRRAFVDAVEVSRKKKKKKKQQRLSQQPVFSTGPVVGRSRTGRNKTRPTQPASQTDRQTLRCPSRPSFSFPPISITGAFAGCIRPFSVTHYSFINVRSFLLSSVIR